MSHLNTNSRNGRQPSTYQSIDTHELLKREIMGHGGSSSVDSGSNFRFSTVATPVINTRIEPSNSDAGFVGRNSSVYGMQKNSGYRDDSDPQQAPLITPAWGPAVQTPTSLPLKRKEIGVIDKYIRLDSTQKEENSNPSAGLYEYDMLKLNNNTPIETIIKMKIGEFYFPRVSVNASYQPNYFYFNRIFIEMEEIGSTQQVADTGIKNRNYHFEFDVVPAGIMNRAIPIHGFQTYNFGMPVRDISRVRLRFKTPLDRYITFQEDVFTVSAVIPAPGPPPANRRLRTSIPHGLTIGSTQSVWITNYNSANEQLNVAINSIDGQLVDVIDATTVQLTTTPGAQLISTTLTATGGIPTGRMNIGERRIAMTMLFRTLKDYSTNYITP